MEARQRDRLTKGREDAAPTIVGQKAERIPMLRLHLVLVPFDTIAGQNKEPAVGPREDMPVDRALDQVRGSRASPPISAASSPTYT